MFSRKGFVSMGSVVAITLFWALPVFAQPYPMGDMGIPENYEDTIRQFDAAVFMDGVNPAAFDWRDFGAVTPAKDQGSCNGCWAFAAVGVLESKILIFDGPSYDLSEQHQLSCNTHPDMHGCQGGWMTSLLFWETEGPMMESCTGYPSFTGMNFACSTLSGCDQSDILGAGYYTVDVSDNNNIKTSTLYDGPAYFRFVVHNDFIDYWDNAAADAVYTNAVSSPLGGHAVLIIGWDDSKNAWLLKNSWGETAGPNGDGTFWMAYSGHASNLAFGMANLEEVTFEDEDDCTCDVGCDSARTTAGTLNTTDAVCYEIDDEIKGWTAWNIHGRTIEVNDVILSQGDPLPPKINGKYYFGFSAGLYPWAGWTHWTW